MWNGRGDNHRVVPDGPYRVRIGLRDQGRTVTLRRQITVDTTPPRPTVTITSPGGAGPALFPAPGVRAITVRTETPLFARPRFQVYRMDVGAPRLQTQFYGDPNTGAGTWDGTNWQRTSLPGRPDRGSGPGLDSLLAPRRAGPTGKVVGVDLCPEMVEKARRNALLLGPHNVEFVHARIESLEQRTQRNGTAESA